MRSFGKLLQLMGLIMLPLAMLLELTDTLGRPFGVSDMVTMLVFGIAVFLLGRVVEDYGAR